jgi:hypothetical protein
LSDRQKQLAIGALVLLFSLFAADQMWSRLVADPRRVAMEKHTRLAERIRKTKLQIKLAKQQVKRLDQWRACSLPVDVQSARSLYQGWLNHLVKSAGLEQRVFDSGSPVSRTGLLVLPFTVRGTGSMAQLTELLYRFYRAPHLHRIRTLSITPVASGARLSLSFAIEALIVGGCERTDQLAEGVGTALASEQLSDYRGLAERNLIGQGPRAGFAEMTELTAVLMIDDISEAWFMNRIEDRLVKLRVGGRLQSGWFDGVVVEIEGNEVVLDDGSQRWLLSRGDRLADATALPPER